MDEQQRPSCAEVRAMRLLDDYLKRRAAGEPVSPAELLAANPDLADELRAHLEVVTCLEPGPARIAELVAQGLLQPSADPSYAAVLGPYKITGFLGRGGMGIVLRAYEQGLDRTVALKVLRPDLVHDETALTRFTREAKAAAALQHPNIVTIHAIGQEAGVHYIAMEFVDGPSLAEVIRKPSAISRQPSASRAKLQLCAPPSLRRIACPEPAGGVASSLPTDFVRGIFRQLLSALEAAHTAGLIHRDIKSANILLHSPSCQSSVITSQPGAGAVAACTDNSELNTDNLQLKTDHFSVRLADFGLARMRSSQTKVTIDGSVLGTPEYMSPEQARGDADIDHRTDLYSAGVVLYEMLTGETPFHADTPTATIHRILNEQPRDPRKLDKSINPVLASLALRLMAKRREDRLDAVADALAAMDRGRRVSLPRSRHKGHGLLLAIGALAVIAVLAAWWGRNRVGATGAPPATAIERPITEVKVSGDKDPLRVVVERGFGGQWEEFHHFPPTVDAIATDPIVIDLDGRGCQLVVVGTKRAMDGDCIFAFDASGSELWRLSLTPSPQIAWSDVTVRNEWGCRWLTKGEFDDQPGEEVLAVGAHISQYPDRISIVDPRTREISPTFWHMGTIEGLWVYADFFAPGKPAIIAWGANNKLDGFAQPQSGDDPAVTHYDIVSAVMILDPRTMNGLGPPRTGQLALPPGRPHAYAFLDLPNCADSEFGQMGVALVTRSRAEADDDCPSPMLEVSVSSGRSEGAQFVVDRNLTASAHCIIVNGQAQKHVAPEWWFARWHPLIQNGEYIGQ